jgi:hypothetical protein
MKKEIKEVQEEPKKHEKKEPDKKMSKIDKEMYWLLGVMAGLIIVFLASNAFFQSLKSFEYEGLSFTKEKFGDIPVYRYYYYTHPSAITTRAVDLEGDPTLINLLFRVDPRENKVEVLEDIDLPQKDKFLYISINDTNLKECEYTQVAIANFASFFVANGYTIQGAVPDKELAKEINVRYAECGTHPDNGVILIQSGEKTQISETDRNCFLMEIDSCEDILAATEKFQIQTIIDAKERNEKKDDIDTTYTQE